MQVFLIRHPRPAIEPGICYGRLDVDCFDVAAAALALRRQIPADTPVFSSPLRRALRLAKALSSTVRIDPRLREIDFGRWEGCRWDAIDRAAIDAWAEDVLGFVPPGGESVAALYARAADFAASLDPALERVAIVTHAGVMRALLGFWQGLEPAEWSRLQFCYGAAIPLVISSRFFPHGSSAS